MPDDRDSMVAAAVRHAVWRGRSSILDGPMIHQLFGDPYLWGVHPHELFRDGTCCGCDSCVGLLLNRSRRPQSS